MNVTITQNALSKIKELLQEESEGTKLRVFVHGGGCSGFQYGFEFTKEQNEDDFVFGEEGVTVLIDAMSIQYMMGATIDYEESLMGASFNINNPGAETTCGCGSSFSHNGIFDEFEYETYSLDD